jgi:hypothetical protein
MKECRAGELMTTLAWSSLSPAPQEISMAQRIFHWWKVLSWPRISVTRGAKRALGLLRAAVERKRRGAAVAKWRSRRLRRRTLRALRHNVGRSSGFITKPPGDPCGTSRIGRHVRRRQRKWDVDFVACFRSLLQGGRGDSPSRRAGPFSSAGELGGPNALQDGGPRD